MSENNTEKSKKNSWQSLGGLISTPYPTNAIEIKEAMYGIINPEIDTMLEKRAAIENVTPHSLAKKYILEGLKRSYQEDK